VPSARTSSGTGAGGKDHGVRFVRSRVHALHSVPEGERLEIGYLTEQGNWLEETFDLVVLSTGIEVPADVVSLAEKLGIQLDNHHFARSRDFLPVGTSRPGVYACGMFSGRRTFPVGHRGECCGLCRAADLARPGESGEVQAALPELDVGTGERGIGVFICNCGSTSARWWT